MGSTLKTAILLAFLSGLLIVAGGAIGGQSGLVFAFILALLMNAGSYWFSDKIVLRMYHAQEVGPDHPLYRIVARLAQKAGLPMPKVYIIPEMSPNAFATGRNPEHAAVAATEGILRLLPEPELEGVIAHELAHVKNRDIVVQTPIVMISAALIDASRLGGWLERALLFVLGPTAAALQHLLLSPKRELAADRKAAEICESPHGLADALVRLDQAAELVEFQASPAAEPLFTINPFEMTGLAAIFSSHPPVAERVRRLRALDPQTEKAAKTETGTP
jgi:heat shock protein HtpX